MVKVVFLEIIIVGEIEFVDDLDKRKFCWFEKIIFVSDLVICVFVLLIIFEKINLKEIFLSDGF